MTKLISSILLLLIIVGSIAADWAVIPLNELVADSDLVVLGTLHTTKEDEEGLGSGFILVDEIITSGSVTGQRTTEGERLKPGQDLKITWADNWACASGMHRSREGKKGIWLLNIVEDGTVNAGYPGRFQPVGELEKIRKLLIRLKPEPSVAVEVRRNVTITSYFDKRRAINEGQSTDLSFLRASIVLMLSTAVYWVLYKSRFRIR